MRIRQIFAASALGLAALGLTGCATGLPTKVTRFQAAEIPAGQSFYVVPAQGSGDAEFYHYATILSQQLEARGYRAAGAPQLADMLVRLDYGVDQGRVDERDDPFYRGGFGSGYAYGWNDPFYDPFYSGYYGRSYRSRYSSFPYYYGWNDPFYSGGFGYGAYGPYGRGYDSYTVYRSHLDMNISQRASGAPLFEGHAKARSSTDELNALVPNLIEAMFTGFPGRNGETVRITVPPRPKS